MQTNQTFACYDARLHTLPDAPTLRAATHEQLVAHYERLKALNADAIQPRFGTKPDDADGFFESACHGMLLEEDNWRQCISHGALCEMATYAVLFPPRTPQEIADRTAKTLRLINSDADNFSALLARGERCCVCRRHLEDEVSKLLGIGPDCARQLGLPHNLGIANRLLRRRKELLGSAAVG